VNSLALLADPIRSALYNFIAASHGEVGRDEAARAVGANRSVASYHLDRLAAEGLLEVDFRRLSGRQGPGAGRTAKVYRRAEREIGFTLPPRRYERASRILATAFDRLPEGARDALVAAAREEGARLAALDPGDGDGLSGLMASLVRHGYEPVASNGEVRLHNCPFRPLAQNHRRLICGINFELLGALLERLASQDLETVYDPRPEWCCVVIRRTQVAPSRESEKP